MTQRAIVIYGLHGDCGAVRYVGKTANAQSRYRDHCRRWSWVTGYVILEETTIERWDAAEREWIRYFRMLGHTLENKTSGGGSLWQHAPESREKMRLAQTGRRHTPESREKLRIAMVGRDTVPKETRARISAALKGHVVSDETRQKIGAANKGRQSFLGKRHSEESIAKMRLVHLGQIVSQEARAKMGASRKGNQNAVGHRHSPESQAKMRAKMTPARRAQIGAATRARRLGTRHSEETRAKIRAAAIRRYERERAS